MGNENNKEAEPALQFERTIEDSFKVDNREIYFRGFQSLSEVEKAKVLTGFLLSNGAPDASTLTVNEKIKVVETEHAIWKEKEDQKNRKILTYAGFVVMVILLLFFANEIRGSGFLSDKDNASMFINLVSKIADLVLADIPPPPEN